MRPLFPQNLFKKWPHTLHQISPIFGLTQKGSTKAYFGRLRNEIMVRDFLRIVMPSLLSKESFLKQWGHITSLNRSDLCVESKIKGDLGGTLQSFSLVYSHVITGINQDDSRSFLKKDFCSKIAAEVILKRRK